MAGKTYILCATVAFQETILAHRDSPLKHKLTEYEEDIEKASLLVPKVLKRICKVLDDHKKTYYVKGFDFHFIMEREIVYLCATHEKFPQKMAFGFLREIMVEWNKTYSRFDCVRAAPEEMTDDFKPVFTKKMLYYSEQGATRVKDVLVKAEEVKHVAVNNVEKLFQRAENIEMVEYEANEMATKGGTFKKVTKKYKQKKWWTLVKWRCYLVIACAVLIILIVYLIGTLICGGFKLPRCIHWISQIFK